MSNRIWGCLISILLLCNYSARAQTLISGIVYDSVNHNRLPYCNVYIVGTTVGVVANEKGDFKFTLPDSLQGKEMAVALLGYAMHIVKVSKQVGGKQLEIYLSPENTTLKEVLVSPVDYSKYKQVSVGAVKPNSGDIDFAYGNEIAAFIPNEQSQSGIIKSIRFYVTKKGFPTEPFGANIYGVDSKTGAPGQNLIDTCFVLSAQKGNEWVELDISKYHISIPSDGFYIAMRWLPNSKNDLYTINGGSKEIVASGQSLSAAKKTSESRTYTRIYLSGWSDFSTLFNAAIGATLLLNK